MKHLVKTSDGRRIALATRGRAGTRFIVYNASNLKEFRVIESPKAVAYQWSPTGHSLGVEAPNGDLGIVGVDPGYATISPIKTQFLMWDKSGNAAFSSIKFQDSRDSKGSQWRAIDLRAGSYMLVDWSQAVKQTALYGAPEQLVDYPPSFSPFVGWSRQGVIYQSYFGRALTEEPTGDVYFANERTKILSRAPMLNKSLEDSLMVDGERVWYVTAYWLFSKKDSPDGSMWVGYRDLDSNRRRQWAVGIDCHISEFELVSRTSAVRGPRTRVGRR